MASRRDVLAGLAATLAASALPCPARAGGGEAFVGGRLEGEEAAFATAFDTAGAVLFDIALPARMHGAAQRPGHGEAALMARRPGTFGIAVDTATGAVRHRFATAPGRWFNGHAVFIGEHLMATETVAATGEGIVGVYDAAAGYRRIGEVASGGLEPHDIGLLGDGTTLAIANGGLMRDPGRPAEKTNVDTMAPCLSYVDGRDGRLLERVAPLAAWHKLGTRHLSVAPDDTVAVAMQYDGAADDAVPLFALHRRGGAALDMLTPPAAALQALRQYCGSVAFDRAGEVLCVTSPPGGTVLFWDVAAGEVLATRRLADGCGIASDRDGGFVVSSGFGGVMRWLPELATAVTVTGRAGRLRWDNHLLRLG